MSRRGSSAPTLSSQSCKGRSLLEIMWEELDAVVERLLTDEEAEDGRDPGRAEGVAHCIALVTNPYLPDIQAVREEAMRRYEEKESS